MGDRNIDNGYGGSTLQQATAYKALFGKAAITTRAQLRTYVATGNLPGGATITAAVFQRALLVLSANLLLPGERTDDDAVDTGA